MNNQQQDCLLNTLALVINNLGNSSNEVREAGLAAVGIARDLAERIELCDDPGQTLVETLREVWELTDHSKIKVIKKLRDRTGLYSLLIAKNFVDALIKMWETSE